MTQYMLTVHYDEAVPDPPIEELRQSLIDVDALNTTMRDTGIFVFGGGLHPPDVATVVRRSGRDIVVTDGPYAETKEHVGGFWIIEVPDLDEALAWARRATVACLAPVEVRPFMDGPPTLPPAQ